MSSSYVVDFKYEETDCTCVFSDIITLKKFLYSTRKFISYEELRRFVVPLQSRKVNEIVTDPTNPPTYRVKSVITNSFPWEHGSGNHGGFGDCSYTQEELKSSPEEIRDFLKDKDRYYYFKPTDTKKFLRLRSEKKYKFFADENPFEEVQGELVLCYDDEENHSCYWFKTDFGYDRYEFDNNWIRRTKSCGFVGNLS